MTTQSNYVQALADLPAPKKSSLSSAKWVFVSLGVLLLVLFAGVYFAVQWLTQSKQAELEVAMQHRIQYMIEEKAKAFSQWIDGQIEWTTPILESDLFRMYAQEIDRQGTSQILPAPLAEQLPYMREVLNGLMTQPDLSHAYLVNRNGIVYLSTTNAPELSASVKEAVQKVYETGSITIPPLETMGESLLYSILLPIYPVQALSNTDARRIIGVLAISAPLDARIKEFLDLSKLMQNEGELLLAQQGQNGPELLVPGKIPPILSLRNLFSDQLPKTLSFGIRPGLSNGKAVFSMGIPVERTPWMVVMEVDHAQVLEQLEEEQLTGLAIGGLLSLFVTALLLVLWQIQSGSSNRAHLEQYKEFAARIQGQRRLLDSINDAIVELISVTDIDGRYVYTNTAFANAVNLPSSMIIGQTAHTLFDAKDIATLLANRDLVLSFGVPVETETQLTFVALGERWVNLVQAPLFDEKRQPAGIVYICHDVTTQVEAQQRRESAIRSTVRVLTGTIEAVDPYLSGHSNRVEGVVRGIARQMHLAKEETSALEIAANLSQIGKLSVPRTVLTKQGRLTVDERKVMEGHVNHAQHILSNISFDLPVPAVIAQMHERLDGSGYPLGLKSDQISLLGRILAVADVFSARIAARSYRASMSPLKVVEFLEQSADQFDAKVVAALKAFLESEDGQVVLDQVGKASTPQPPPRKDPDHPDTPT